jgi:PadR family transcriptional regulator, regulatory protein PadR
MGKPSDLIQGTLDLLILKTVSLEPKHGWAIAKRIQQVSQDALQVTQGSLYPALHRLEQQGWLRAKSGQTDTGREAKFYALTPAGRKQLARETREWQQTADLIASFFALKGST